MTRTDSTRGPHEPHWDEATRHHIDLIQMTIIRLSAASAAAKGWLLPVVTATYGYALVQDDAGIAALGCAACVHFWSLDTRYLREERSYRKLFGAVVSGSNLSERYDMNASKYYRRPGSGTADERDMACNFWRVGISWSTAGFYAPILAIGAVVILLVA